MDLDRPPTDKQKRVLWLVGSTIRETGLPPTQQAIADFLGCSSHNSAEQHLFGLQKRGLIVRHYGKHCGIQLTAKGRALYESLNCHGEFASSGGCGPIRRIAGDNSPQITEASDDAGGTLRTGSGAGRGPDR